MVPTLNQIPKWHKVVRNLKENDLALIIDKNSQRKEWPLGRITEAIKGRHGLVRKVEIKSGNKTYLRPVSMLIPLDIESNSNEVPTHFAQISHLFDDSLALNRGQ